MDEPKLTRIDLADPDFEPSDEFLQVTWPKAMMEGVRERARAERERRAAKPDQGADSETGAVTVETSDR